MSFYTYYGKLEDEFLVAVLLNGTVEPDDPVYIYSKKRFSTYKAADVTVAEDGEDAFLFKDGYYTYNAVPKRSNRELDLTVKGGSHKPMKVTLVRHYAQALSATPPTDSPNIWTGTLKFHEWAHDEPIIVIAPQGLRKGNPIISLWQWTKYANGVHKALSYSTAQQESDAKDLITFSFNQNGYYTMNCKINTETKGLNITMKSPSNPEATQDELTLSAEVISSRASAANNPRLQSPPGHPIPSLSD